MAPLGNIPPWARPEPGSHPLLLGTRAARRGGGTASTLGAGVSTTSAAAGSCLGRGRDVHQRQPGLLPLSGPSVIGPHRRPALSRGHSSVWSLPPRLCCSALPARSSPATACARRPPPLSPGRARPLRCPLTFSFPCARPAASRLGCGARDDGRPLLCRRSR